MTEQTGAVSQSNAGIKPLSVAESERLKKLEQVILDNMLGFYAVGCALKEIRDSKLYRETHKTFEAYCKEVWDTGARSAQRRIKATVVFDHIKSWIDENATNWSQKEEDGASPAGGYYPAPINESQIRPLTRDDLSPGNRIVCWKAACQKAQLAGRNITAHYVEEAVVEFLGGRAKRQLREVRKNLNDAEFVLEFKRAMTPVIQVLNDAQEAGWKDTSRQKILKLIDELRAIVAGDKTDSE